MIRYGRKFGIHTLLILLFIFAVLCLSYCGRAGREVEQLATLVNEEPISENPPEASGAELLTETSIPSTATQPPEEPASEPTTESTMELSTELSSEPTTEPLLPTSPPEENLPVKEEPTADLTSLVSNEYVQHMFDTAIEYEGDDGEMHIVEPPPFGRSVDLQKKILPLSSTPPQSDYLDDTIFIGDSVTTGFESFRKNIEFCGEKIPLNYKVFAAKSYGAYNSTIEISDKSVHPLYKGDQFYPEDIIGIYESKKVFLCIGLNDAGWEKEDQFIRYYRTLLTKIKEKNPDVKIIIASITPLTKNGESTTTNDLKNPRIAEFNNLLINLAHEENVFFLDYAYALRDEENNLYDNFASDDYCHLTVPAYSRMMEYIFFHPVD